MMRLHVTAVGIGEGAFGGCWLWEGGDVKRGAVAADAGDVMYGLHNPGLWRRSGAFSVVELIIVALALAIAAAIVLPGASDLASTRLREAGQLVVADLEYARSAAIAHGSDPRLVVFKPAENQYFVAARSDKDEPVEAPGTSGKYRVTFGQGRARSLDDVAIQATNLTDNELTFDMYGGTKRSPEAGDATITLSCEGKTVTITVDRVTGAATMSDLK